MKLQLKISLTLFVLGMVGVLSFLFTSVPLDLFPEEALKDLPLDWLPLLMLVNPTLLLGIMIILGHFMTPKVNLHAPSISRLLQKENVSEVFINQLKYGTALGAIAGILMTLIAKLSMPLLSKEFLEIGNKFSPSPITRFLYGGIAEELLLRWGFMTLIAWVAWKIFSRKETVPAAIYWVAIIISAVTFGVGHLPAVFFFLKEPTTFLIVYVIVANSIFGIIAGWLFWKKGIEAAMLAHMTVHVILLGAELIK